MGDLANALETRFESGVLLPAPVLARVRHASLPTVTLTFRILAATGAVVLTAEGSGRCDEDRRCGRPLHKLVLSVSLRLAVQYVRPVRTREAP